MTVSPKLQVALLTSFLGSCQAPEQPAAGLPPAAEQPGRAAQQLPIALRWPATRRLPPPGPRDTLTAAARALLRRHYLSLIWARADYGEPSDRAMEGFYGPDNYRIAFYFDQVRRDSLHPERFWVQGRNRYRRVITPFAGTMTVRAIFRAVLDRTNRPASADTVQAYAVRAAYALREDPATKGAGVYQGEALLDIYEFAHGALHAGDLGNVGYYPPNQGGGLIFRGAWTDAKTGRRRAAAWADNLQMVTPPAVRQEQLANGPYGDLDPALAHRGWDEEWMTDQWWVKK